MYGYYVKEILDDIQTFVDVKLNPIKIMAHLDVRREIATVVIYEVNHKLEEEKTNLLELCFKSLNKPNSEETSIQEKPNSQETQLAQTS